MSILQAKVGDAQGIAKLAQQLRIDPFRTSDIPKNGFLVYALNPADYSFRIRPRFLHKNPYVLVSKTEGQIDGFFLGYDDRDLAYLQKRGVIGHESGILDAVMQMPKPFIFGDQIGIDPAATRTGLGTKLLDELFFRMRAERIRTFVVAVLHQPVRNQASIDFCTRSGLKFVSEVRNKDNTVWGIYRIEFP
jgi:ribosomal protein S18 acetylase RimI-like enzyme